MNKKRILLSIASLFIILPSYAQEKKYELYGNLGYTHLNGFSYTKTNKVMNSFNGMNLGLSGLYNFNTNTLMTPVLGLSLNSIFTKNSNSINSENVSGSFNYFSTSALGGIKVRYFSNMPIYFLLNLGYSPSNNLSFSGDNSQSYTAKTLAENSFNVKNHYFYGATAMSTYSFSESFSLGGSLTYNRHTMDLEMETPPEKVTERSGFNEYSLSLIAMWSF